MAQRAIIWDMDGVLVDTGEPHYITWRDALAEEGIEYSREDFQATFGMNNHGVLTYVLGEEPDPEFAERLIEKKETEFREIIRQGIEPLPGVIDWLTRFREWGYRQAVASSAPQENIDVQVDGLDIRKYFDAIVSGAGLPPKPNPDVFLQAASEVGVSPENCVVIEDAVAGVGGAKAAGMACIAVMTTNPREKLSEADLILNDLTELSEEAFKALAAS